MKQKIQAILIVEDDEIWQNIYALSFRNFKTLTVLQATNLVDAESLFLKTSNIDVIIMDGCVNKSELNTLPLIKKIREIYLGDLIAVSTISEYRHKMTEAGCNIQISKENVVNYIRQKYEC